MSIFHFTASTLWPRKPFAQREACVEMWGRLRARFRHALACVLMPDHLHLLVEYASAEELLRLMRVELSAFARRIGEGSLWQKIGLPSLVPNLLHLKRQARYIHLNPCRAKLVADPLQWEWSTHREAVGAAFSTWLDRETLERATGFGPRDFAIRFHQYVSSDPDVRVDGTPLPTRQPPSDLLASLAGVEWAVLQAMRASMDSRLRTTSERRLMLLAAERLAGGCDRARQAEWLGVTSRTIQNIIRAPASPAEEAALKAAFWLLSDRPRFVPGQMGW
jgi:hypothetical protein